MKKSYSFKKKAGRKNMIMCLVALVLILITVVGTSYSWIEEVSKVEFNSDNGQETPYKMEAKPLKADASFIDNNTQINLADYFNEGGDMHLSPCYSDGEKFYFPVNNSTSTDKYRLGTKDDANTNYISATFNVKSTTANTSYWFEKIDASTNYLTLSNHSGESVATFPDEVSGSTAEDYLRISVTIDGNTNVYCYNANGKYHKVTGINDDSVDEVQGRRVETYAYYDASNIADQTANRNVSNQNSGNTNLHCNTLFTVPKGQTKTVTIKIWLECRGSGSSLNVRDVRVSNINFRLTSSWAKMRRIYVLDRTESEVDHDSDGEWMYSNNAKIYWALKSDFANRIEVNKTNYVTVDGYKSYYIDVPTVYNGAEVVLFRCNSSGGGNSSFTYDGTTYNYWDMWETAFPDTFHNETFSVYTSKFGTWESVARCVKIINSCRFDYNNESFWQTPYAYMWDSSTDIPGQQNKRVVENKAWPGVSMTNTNSQYEGFDIYSFYYNSIYDRIIFNDHYNPPDYAYQTEDINLDQAKTNPQYYVGKYYDMATMKWYDQKSDLPTYSDCCLYGEFSTGQKWKMTRFTNSKNNASNTNQYCRIYIKAAEAGNYQFKVYDFANNTTKFWGAAQNSDIRAYVDTDKTLTDDNPQNAEIQNLSKGLYEVWWKPNDKQIYFHKLR